MQPIHRGGGDLALLARMNAAGSLAARTYRSRLAMRDKVSPIGAARAYDRRDGLPAKQANFLLTGDSIMLKTKGVLLAACVGAVVLAGCSRHEVSFKSDVMPILNSSCVECHRPGGKGFAASGLLLDSYADVMKGTKHGPVIKPGDGLSSPFNQVIEGRVDKSIRMPHGGTPIPEENIKTLRAWVDQGAKNN